MLDSETGKPIPAVIVEGIWTNEKIAIGFEARSDLLQLERWISDFNGVVKIPAYTGVGLLGWFKGLSIDGKHPLYPSMSSTLFGPRARM